MILDGQPNPFAFQMLYPSLYAFLYSLLLLRFPVFVVLCILSRSHPWPHFTTINFMWFFFFSCAKLLPYVFMCVSTVLFFVLFASPKAQIYTHSTTWPAVDVDLDEYIVGIALLPCVRSIFSICRHRFPFKSIKIKPNTHTRTQPQ